MCLLSVLHPVPEGGGDFWGVFGPQLFIGLNESPQRVDMNSRRNFENSCILAFFLMGSKFKVSKKTFAKLPSIVLVLHSTYPEKYKNARIRWVCASAPIEPNRTEFLTNSNSIRKKLVRFESFESNLRQVRFGSNSIRTTSNRIKFS